MSAVKGWDMAVLKKARKSSLMTQAEFAEKLLLERGKSANVRTIVEWEKRPDQVPLSTIQDYYSLCGTDAREWIKDFVSSYFYWLEC